MRRQSEYVIPFNSYSAGKHVFEFEITDKFFEIFPDSEVNQGTIAVKVMLDRQDRQLEFDIALEGTVRVACDLCAETFDCSISKSYTLYGKFGHGRNDDEYDVLWIQYGDHEVDLTQHIFEYIILSLPMKKVHPDNEDGSTGCNEEMLKLLDNFSIEAEED